MDWDLHETKGLEWLEDLIDEIKRYNERRAEAAKAAEGFMVKMTPQA